MNMQLQHTSKKVATHLMAITIVTLLGTLLVHPRITRCDYLRLLSCLYYAQQQKLHRHFYQ